MSRSALRRAVACALVVVPGALAGASSAHAALAQQAYVKPHHSPVGQFFGHGVAIDGDTMVVGARAESSGAVGVNDSPTATPARPSSGAAYVYVRTGATWTQQAYLKASNPGENDGFGWSVDVDGDTIVVGARDEDSAAVGVNGNQADDTAGNSGAAYVFTRTGTTWSQQAYLKASNTEANDNYGVSVGVDGDTIVVGAAAEASASTGVNGNQNVNGTLASGAAYVYTRTAGSWSQQAYLKASNTGFNDRFAAVAVSGDRIVVGAWGEASQSPLGDQANNSASGAGAAYVFARTGTTWTQEAFLKAGTVATNDRFGWSVAIDGSTIAIGATGDDSVATGVGGTEADDSANDAGAAWVFVRSAAGEWTRQAYVKASNTRAGQSFGHAIAVDGDRLVVGATGESSTDRGVDGPNPSSTSASLSGAAFTYTRSGTTWTPEHRLKASNADNSDQLGWSIGVSGGTVVSGAYLERGAATGINGDPTSNTAMSAGAAYVFAAPLPARPTQVGTDPSGGGNTTSPKVRGVAPAGSTVTVYRSGDCSGAPVGSGTAAAFALGGAGISITVPANTVSTLTATATVDGVASPCSEAITYEHDGVAPGKPTLAVTRVSATQVRVRVTGTEPGLVFLFRAAMCSGPPQPALSTAQAADEGFLVDAPESGTTTISATVTDRFNNPGACSDPVTIGTAPASPASPAAPASPAVAPDGGPAAVPAVPVVTPNVCRSVRRFTVRLLRGARSATVTLGGRRLAVRREQGRLVTTVDLRGRPAQTVTLRIRVVTRGGRVVQQTRTYRTCVFVRAAT